MNKLAAYILKYKYFIVVVTTLITLFFGYSLKDLKINADLLSYLPENDKTAALFYDIGKNYGGNDMVMIGVQNDNVFDHEVLTHIKQITDTLKSVNGVTYVSSLTDIIDIKGSDWGIEIGKLIDEYNIPETKEELKILQEYTLSKEMYKGSIVSEDASSSIIIAKLDADKNKVDVTKDIIQKIEQLDLPEEIFFGGFPVTIYEAGKIISHDIIFLLPIAMFLIFAVLFFSFRTTRGVVLPVLVVTITIIWVMGLLSLLGFEISLITNIIPVILLAVGSAYVIHVINRINEEKEKDFNKRMLKSLAYIIVPVFLTSVTTFFGFISFVAGAYLTMIREFGIFTSIGVIFALILSVTFAPSLISIFNWTGGNSAIKSKSGKEHFLTALLKKLNYAIFHYSKPILIAWSVVILISIIGAFRVERKVDIIDYFKENTPVKASERLLQTKFTGTQPLFIQVTGNMQSPEVLTGMKEIQDFIESTPYIKKSQSVADLIMEMNDVMGEGKLIPEDEAKIQQLWFLLEGQEIMDQLVSYDLDEGLIQANAATMEIEELKVLNDELNEFLIQNKNDAYQVKVTGMPLIYEKIDNSLVNGQRNSLVFATLLVFLIVSILFKSVSKGALAIIPIVTTLIVLFGFMGLTGIPLDIATVLTGSITIGIGIDYAIHFLTHFNADFKKTKSIPAAIEENINISGKAIVINVMTVSLGFLSLLLSNLIPLQRFGVLIAVTMIISGLSTLTLLPIALLKMKKLKNVFRLPNNKLKENNNVK